MPRLLNEGDLPELMRLKESAGWNQTEQDWLRILRLAPEGCFGIEVDGTLAAATTVLRYGTALAWIGMVLTLPDFRRRGLARILMQRALEYSTSCRTGLDASDMGRPLYESLGFVEECAIERWIRPGRQGVPGRAVERPVPLPDPVIRLDAETTGADRSRLLEDLAQFEFFEEPGGFAFGRPGSAASYFGPCAATDSAVAGRLVRKYLASHESEAIAWDLFPHHREAVALAREAGFSPVRNLTRMVLRPAPAQAPDARQIAIAGFEFA